MARGAVMGFHSVKFNLLGEAKEKRGNLSHVFFKPFSKRFRLKWDHTNSTHSLPAFLGKTLPCGFLWLVHSTN